MSERITQKQIWHQCKSREKTSEGQRVNLTKPVKTCLAFYVSLLNPK